MCVGVGESVCLDSLVFFSFSGIRFLLLIFLLASCFSRLLVLFSAALHLSPFIPLFYVGHRRLPFLSSPAAVLASCIFYLRCPAFIAASSVLSSFITAPFFL
ncbi:hypothetical protein C8J57DRAFT_1318143 [Mycena rebaudengoi]|nr:hypothetical protein C8J57DRAFT_1318143 [Mycena rebaudengoi]